MTGRSTVAAIDKPTVAIIRADERTLRLLLEFLATEGCETQVFRDVETFLARSRPLPPALVFLDIGPPSAGGLDVLPRLKALDPKVPLVVITAQPDMDQAVRAVRAGAFEFLASPLSGDQLRTVTRHALSLRALSLRATERVASDHGTVAPLVGRHRSMLQVYKLIGMASAPGNRSTVLITGETGVGKNVVARAIHDRSPSCTLPFQTVQCSGLPESLLENELFGHEKGAYTGATDRRLGRVEAAGAGALLLDEIAEIVPAIQLKLLRLLESGEFERLGGHQTLTRHCRFIAATNGDLAQMVADGLFRSDLFYRLKVIHIHVPSLREHSEDIPLLAHHFVDRLARRTGLPYAISPAAMELLRSHPFPGNVRELAHLIEYACALVRSDVLLPEDFPALLGRPAPSPATPEVSSLPIVSSSLAEAREHINMLFERQFVAKVLAEAGGNVTHAAKLAGVRRQYLQRLMQKVEFGAGSAQAGRGAAVAGLPFDTRDVLKEKPLPTLIDGGRQVFTKTG